MVQRFCLSCIRDREGTEDYAKNEEADHTEDGRFFLELRALKMFQGVVLLPSGNSGTGRAVAGRNLAGRT